MNTISLTLAQKWLRSYSEQLEASFRSSQHLRHQVTKGESREQQILDALSGLLPTRISVEKNVVIVNSENQQAPKFDGALIDRSSWPRIFAGDNSDYTVVMLESVLTAIEIKSSLDKTEMDSIFKNSAEFRKMKKNSSNPSALYALVTAFAYECPNINLSFFDFAASFAGMRELSPSLICILNCGLFGLADITGGNCIPVDEPRPGAMPILYYASDDALLVYLYFLSRWATTGTRTAKLFEKYSDDLFSKMRCFSFDSDFLQAIVQDIGVRDTARKHFMRQRTANITNLYANARSDLSLS